MEVNRINKKQRGMIEIVEHARLRSNTTGVISPLVIAVGCVVVIAVTIAFVIVGPGGVFTASHSSGGEIAERGAGSARFMNETDRPKGMQRYDFSGTITGRDHRKHYVDLAPNATSLQVVLKWEDTRQDLDLAIGKGECPHHGETVAEDNGGSLLSGEGEVTLTVTDGSILSVPENGSEEQWFIHIAADPGAYQCDYDIVALVAYPTTELDTTDGGS